MVCKHWYVKTAIEYKAIRAFLLITRRWYCLESLFYGNTVVEVKLHGIICKTV